MATLLITHDLHLVRRFAQRVAVMERGCKVERGATEAIFKAPQHPYTIQLLNSFPVRQVKPLAPDADIKGSENIADVKSSGVDALMHNYYVLPWRYLKNHYPIYHQRLCRLAVAPGCFGPYEWLLAAWWDGTSEAAIVN